MKKTATLLLSLFAFIQFIFAQMPIPNPSFEAWTSGQPTSWGTSDGVLVQIGQPDPGTAEQDTAAANVFAGSSSVRLTNKHVTTPIGARDIPGVVSLGNITLNLLTFSPEVTGYAYTDRPDSIRFAAKYTSGPGGTDTGNVAITLTRWTPNGRLVIARTVTHVIDNALFTVFTKKIDYFSIQTPDTLLVQAIATSSLTMVLESEMWVDDFSLIGLDTAFKAYVNPSIDVAACDGDTVRLVTDPSISDTYQWYKDNTSVNGATQPLYEVMSSGSYFVEVNHGGNIFTSDSVSVVFNPLPAVSYTVDATQDTVCSNAAAFALAGGVPGTGFYTGSGITNNHFTPSSAGAGLIPVTYAVTNTFGCTASVTQNILVVTCTGIEKLDGETRVDVYPNPATNNFCVIAKGFSEKETTMKIYNEEGQLVFQKNISAIEMNTGIKLNASLFTNGVYMLEVSNNEKQLKTRLIISK